jgi:hypothetical protein
MLYSEPETSANRNIWKFAAAAAAMAVLAGCAVAVQLPPLATSFQDSRDRDFACAHGSKCPNRITNHRVAYRRSQPVGGGKIDEDPPDFILNSRDPEGMPPIRTQME